MPQNADQSDAIRDALAKTLYERLFDFIIDKVNASMANSAQGNVIGVLDIYGFEVFEENSFEQVGPSSPLFSTLLNANWLFFIS